LKLLLDEMYSSVHAEALRAAGIDAETVLELGLAGSSDPEVFAEALARDRALLTENVADFARIAAEHLTAGLHHPGVVIALSSRFSRRRVGIGSLVGAIRAIAAQHLGDRVVYLQRAPVELGERGPQ
jgi:predicted nuclease of predicted toxin-antitoxin system